MVIVFNLMHPIIGPNNIIFHPDKMTIKRLAEYLRDQNVPKLGRRNEEDEEVPLYMNQLKTKKIAIEVAGLVYRQNWAAVKHVMKNHTFIFVSNKDGIGGYWSRPADEEIHTMFKVYFRSFVKRILDSGVIPVFVVEGKAPDMKGATIQKRVDGKKEQSDKADALRGNIELDEFKKKLLYAYPPGARHAEIVLEVLKDMGVTTVRAKHEAEGVCAYLVNTDYISDENGIRTKFPLHCDVALTDDYDIFMYGCRAVIRNLRSAEANKGYFEAEGYAFEDILYTLGFLPIDEDGNRIPVSSKQKNAAEGQFRLMCILCGSDYSDNVRGLGPAKICAMIKKHNVMTYEDACKVEPKFTVIPYDKIIQTIEKNKEFVVIDPGVTSIAKVELEYL